MALLTGYGTTGLTHVFVRRNAAGEYLKDLSIFSNYSAGDVDHYDIPATEDGDSGIYTATDPADGIPGDYILVELSGADLTEADLANNVVWQETLSDVGDSTADTAAAVWAYLTANATASGSMGQLVVSLAALLSGVSLTDATIEELRAMVATQLANADFGGGGSAGGCGCNNRARAPIASSGQVTALKRR
jgi:hypothetical protein